jgi:hypothetical protein
MHLLVRSSLIALAALGAAARAGASDAKIAALSKQERLAREKCAGDLVKLARALTGSKAIGAARVELRRAMAIAPTDSVCRKESSKLPPAAGEVADSADDKSKAAIEPVHARCVTALVELLKAWDKADRPDEFARLATVIHAELAGEQALESFDLEWSEELGLLFRKKDAARLAAGDEFIDGAWVDATAVAKLDASHADWKKPWVLSDGVHEVRTTMSRRTARRVLEHVTAFRRVVLDEFVGEWDLRPPKGSLPVIVTATQEQFRERVSAFPRAAQMPSAAAAVYVGGSTPLGPCIATFEPRDTDGSVKKIGWPGFLVTLRHEVAHQILYEYSKHGSAGAEIIGWCSEGIANYLACFEPLKGHWRLRRRALTPFAIGYLPGPFAWVKSNLERVGPISKRLLEAGAPATAEAYLADATLAYFLLEGEGRRYRQRMIRLAELVHQGRGDGGSFQKVFGKVDFAKLQAEWEAFVRSLEIER